jgi:hypothetical protein
MIDDLKDNTRQIHILKIVNTENTDHDYDYVLQCFFKSPMDPGSKLYLHFGTYDSWDECIEVYLKIENLGLGELYDLHLQQYT